MSSDESDEEQVDYEDDSEDESEDGVAGGFRGEDVRQSSEEDVHSKSLEERLKEMEEEKEQRAFRHDSVRNSVRQKRLGAEGASEDISSSTRVTSLKRENKNAPAVMRSDRPVKRLRIDSNLKTNNKGGDPRFSEISGKLNSRKFMESYKFLEGYQEKEVELLSQQMSKVKKDDEKEAIKAELIKSRQEMKERQRDQAVKKRLSELKKIERQKVAQGKKPFFLKESVKKDIALEERYDELKKEGKLQKFLVKKRKKNANKDHRWLPYERREN